MGHILSQAIFNYVCHCLCCLPTYSFESDKESRTDSPILELNVFLMNMNDDCGLERKRRGKHLPWDVLRDLWKRERVLHRHSRPVPPPTTNWLLLFPNLDWCHLMQKMVLLLCSTIEVINCNTQKIDKLDWIRVKSVVTYVANGALISSLCLECLRHVMPVRRSPSNPKKLINFRRLGGNNDTDNWKSP